MTYTNKIMNDVYDYTLPVHLECNTPTEERGLERDEVKLLVSNFTNNKIEHSIFKYLDNFLEKGDVLVVNSSGTLKASIKATFKNNIKVNIHFSTKINNNKWIVELRNLKNKFNSRFNNGKINDELLFENGGKAKLMKPYYQNTKNNHLQLWILELDLESSLEEYLEKYGEPIKYQYQRKTYPQSYYQTIFANELGSAEMPSAGRGFTQRLIDKLEKLDIKIVPILLHTGVASLEKDEKPYKEYYKVSKKSADIINEAKSRGRKIIAVGTTVVRTLETVINKEGKINPGKGWTDVFITPEKGIKAIDGLLTGFHEPKASHLLMLEALAGKNHLKHTYKSALANEYKWHEFGDLHLLIP